MVCNTFRVCKCFATCPVNLWDWIGLVRRRGGFISYGKFRPKLLTKGAFVYNHPDIRFIKTFFSFHFILSYLHIASLLECFEKISIASILSCTSNAMRADQWPFISLIIVLYFHTFIPSYRLSSSGYFISHHLTDDSLSSLHGWLMT